MTERLLVSNGWLCDITESHNVYSGWSKDFLNFADFIATSPAKRKTAAIQVTTDSNKGARLKKILSSINAYLWILGGGEVWVISWRKAVIGSEVIWVPKRLRVSEKDFSQNFRDRAHEYWNLRGKCAEKDIEQHKIKTHWVSLD